MGLMGTRRLVYMPLSQLQPAKRNPKKHDLEALIASLRTYGWTDPSTLDERTDRLVGGHGRIEACMMIRQAGHPPPDGVQIDEDGEWLVPVLRDWSSRDDDHAKAYVIAVNRIGEAGKWDYHALAEDIEDLIADSPDLLDAIGMDAAAIDDLLTPLNPELLGEQDPDKPAPAPRSVPDPDPHTPLSTDTESVTDQPADPEEPGLPPVKRFHRCPTCQTDVECDR